MPERLFPFLQADLPFELGPADGRWPLRDAASGEVERIVVLATVGGTRADARRRSRRRARRAAPEPPSPTLPVTRATVIDPHPFDDERAARAWLFRLDMDLEAQTAFGAVNRLLHAHRIAAADESVFHLSPSQALTLRAGFGEGDAVAEGRWRSARELPGASGPRRGRRASLLANSTEQRLVALVGGHERPLLCEELSLRAQADLEAGRSAHAAIELDRAYAAADRELARGAHLSDRLTELSSLRAGVAAQAEAAIAGSGGAAPPDPIDEKALRYALVRLQAALRAHAAQSGRGASDGASR